MNKITYIAKKSLHGLSTAAKTRRAVKHFADKYHMVYFGPVDPRDDEHELVRGLTVSAGHIDNHYTVGTYNHHDIILVERRATLTFPGKQDTHYRWLIAQIDLRRDNMPHIFIDTHHHDAIFYAHAFAAKQHMRDLTSYFNQLSATFTQRCKLFASPAAYAQVGAVITPEVAETIARHFTHFDYEIVDDRLLVYANNAAANTTTLEDMLRVGIWLADHCNSIELPV